MTLTESHTPSSWASTRRERSKIEWLGTEVVKVRELYPFAPWKEIEAALPGRNRNAICSMARRLGIKRPRPIPSYSDPLVEALNLGRIEAGLTMASLATKAGIDRAQLHRTFGRDPKIGTLHKIASALGCRIELVSMAEQSA